MASPNEPIILPPDVLDFYRPDIVRLKVELVRARLLGGKHGPQEGVVGPERTGQYGEQVRTFYGAGYPVGNTGPFTVFASNVELLDGAAVALDPETNAELRQVLS